jgi:hypothetical protein
MYCASAVGNNLKLNKNANFMILTEVGIQDGE